MAQAAPRLIAHRTLKKNKAALIFIHGFSGTPQETWGKFPDFLLNDERLNGWNIFSFGYPTSIWLDLVGIWKADPSIETLADDLRIAVTISPLAQYESLTFIAHSMGGLVLQGALVGDTAFASRVHNVFLFGTPSNGLVKAVFGKFWKRQLRAMAQGSDFIKDLRKRWSEKFGEGAAFNFWAVAGSQDEFVPRQSSIDPFPKEQCCVVPGDHLSIVKPPDVKHPSVQLVLEYLTRKAAESGPIDPASFSVEVQMFHKTIARLGKQQDLDQDGLVELALALEGVGRQADAIKVLEQQIQPKYTDAMGTLAGRLKRRWWMRRGRSDAQRARDLYQKAYTVAAKAGDADQALYNGINVAFMDLGFGNDLAAAQKMAKKVLVHCTENPRDKKWALAAQGEASLLLDDTDVAIQHYAAAFRTSSLKRIDTVRQTLSMYQQAVRVASLMGDESVARRLESVFRGGSQ